MERDYNFIYSKLVKGESDFVGQIAYSLYKQHKISHIEEYIKNHKAEIPEAELKNFHQMSCSEIILEAYRRKAEDILGDFINETLKEAIAEIQTDTINNQSEILKTIIKPITPPNKTTVFWIGVLQSGLATIAVSAVLTLLVLIIYASRVGFLDAISTIFDVDVVQRTGVPK